MNATIYARYSDSSQRDESIEPFCQGMNFYNFRISFLKTARICEVIRRESEAKHQ